MQVGYLSAMGMNDEDQKRDKFMRRAYVAIMSFPEEAVANKKVTKEMKLIALQNIVSYFENIEEYEKCHDLIQLIDQLSNGKKN